MSNYKIVNEFLEKCYIFCDNMKCEDCPIYNTEIYDCELCDYLSDLSVGMLRPWWLREETYEEIMKER